MENYDKPREHIKKQRHHFANKGPYTQGYCFCSSHVQMWELDHKEGWAPKNWCFQTVVLEKALESPLDSKEIKPSVLKEINPEHQWKHWCWSSSTLATWCDESTYWKRLWCWERLRAGGEGNDRGWDGWMASPTQWTIVWLGSWSWLRTRDAWRAAVHGITKSQTQLSN